MTRKTPSMGAAARPWLGGVTFWALSTLLQGVIITAQEGVFFLYALVSSAFYYGVLALLGIWVWSFCSRMEARRPPLIWLVLSHFAVMILVVTLWQVAYVSFIYWTAGLEVVQLQVEQGGLWLLLQALLIYLVMVIGMITIQKSRRLKVQERRSGELRLLAREAELRALRSQLRPHFLFNVLNSIYFQIRVAPEKAEKMTELLSDLLRATLEVSDQPFVSLEEELALTRRYLEIERLRLGERLSTRLDVDHEVRSALVPPLILQPVVENAVRHGIAPFSRRGMIEVEGCRSNSHLECVVRDSGGGPTGGRPDEGRGLGITRARLEKCWGKDASIKFSTPESGGFEVRLRFPLSIPSEPE